MRLKLISQDDSRVDVRYNYKIENPETTNPDGSGLPFDFRIRLKGLNFFRVDPRYIDNGEAENPFRDLDPERYIVYKNAETVQAFIIVDTERNTITLRIPKKSGHFTPKTEKLKSALARWFSMPDFNSIYLGNYQYF